MGETEIGVGILLTFAALLLTKARKSLIWLGLAGGLGLTVHGAYRDFTREDDQLLFALNALPAGVGNLEGVNPLQAYVILRSHRDLQILSESYGINEMAVPQATSVQQFYQLGGLVPEYGQPRLVADREVPRTIDSAITLDKAGRDAIV